LDAHLLSIAFAWEAEAIVANLASIGISATIVRKAREYSSLILGMGDGSFDIEVADADHARAESFLRELNRKSTGPRLDLVVERPAQEPHKLNSELPSILFRKTILFSLLGCLILPIFFSFAALIQYNRLRRSTRQPFYLIVGGLAVLFSWVFDIALVWYLAKTLV
jgi:hypothetical protein